LHVRAVDGEVGEALETARFGAVHAGACALLIGSVEPTPNGHGRPS
jgi:hypothetical protein